MKHLALFLTILLISSLAFSQIKENVIIEKSTIRIDNFPPMDLTMSVIQYKNTADNTVSGIVSFSGSKTVETLNKEQLDNAIKFTKYVKENILENNMVGLSKEYFINLKNLKLGISRTSSDWSLYLSNDRLIIAIVEKKDIDRFLKALETAKTKL